MSTKNALKAALAVIVCVTFGAAVPAANANSALDQYVEEVPNATGKDDGSKGNDRDRIRIDPERAKKLSDMGEDGEILLALASDSAPPTGGAPIAGALINGAANGASSNGNDGNLIPGVGGTIGDRNASPVKSLTAAAGASGLSAPLFGFVLLLAVAMGVTAWLRRSKGHTS